METQPGADTGINNNRNMWKTRNNGGGDLGIGIAPDLSRLKLCNCCKERKPLSEFFISTVTKSGFVSVCKSCKDKRSMEIGCTVMVKEKTCSTCGKTKLASEFGNDKRKMDGLAARCRDCGRWYDIKRLYGVSKHDYEKMFFEQDGKCAICKKPSIETLHVDHCHSTGKARALLCFTCNSGIGMFGDDEQLILSAAEYIRSFKISAPCGEETCPATPAKQ